MAMADTSGPADDLLTPVGRETVQERVYGQLRRTLIGGGFAAGDALRIVDLAERLRTSTMPVREALRRLVSEQALEVLPNRTVRVPLITPGRLDDLQRARTLVEGRLVELAVSRLSPADVDAIDRINRDCDEAFEHHGTNVALATSELNQRFHFAIYRAAGSAVLIPIVESLWLQSGPVVRAAAHIHERTGGRAATNHHHALVAALRGRDVGAATAALGADIGRSFDLVRRSLAPGAEAAA